MASKTFTAYVKNTSSKYGIQTVCTSEPDIASNSSQLTVVVNLIHPYIDISSRSGKLKIDGTTYNFKRASLNKSGPTRMYTKTVTINHLNDGTRSVAISASFPFDLSSNSYGSIGTATVSGTMTLDNIPRTSTIAASTASVVVNGSNEWRLTMTKHADAFRHKATLTFGDQTIVTDVFDTEVGVVIPVAWLNKLPTQTQSTVDVSIQTYTDASCVTTVGNPATTTFEIKVPSDAAPVLNAGWARLSVYNTGTAADGMGVYVQGYSRGRVVFDDSLVELKYGASIVKREVICAGTTSDSMTPVLTVSGRQTVRCVITDSRGYQSGEEFAIDVQPYVSPTLINISLYRCNTAGVEQEDGTMLYFRATCKFSECGGENAVNMIAEWKKASVSIWSNATALENGVGSVLGAGAVDPMSSYNARITATDRLGNEVYFATLISTADTSFNIRDGGKGGAFGKYAEKDGLLDVVWAVLARGGYEPMVLDVDTDFNDIRIPNTYIGGDIKDSNYLNAPQAVGTFNLEVTSVGVGGQLKQRLSLCNKTNPTTYERFCDETGWGAWVNTKLYNWPVGSIYGSDDPTNPEELFGGTWEPIKDRFILAAGDTYAAGSTGGEATHTLTRDEMPKHSHYGTTVTVGASSAVIEHFMAKGLTRHNDADVGKNGYPVYTSTEGGDAAHNNMPPFYAAYAWRRTA